MLSYIAGNLLGHQALDIITKFLPSSQLSASIPDYRGAVLQEGIVQIQDIGTEVAQLFSTAFPPDDYEGDQFLQLFIGMPPVQSREQIISHDHGKPALDGVLQIQVFDGVIGVGYSAAHQFAIFGDELDRGVVWIQLGVGSKTKAEHVHAMLCGSRIYILLEDVACNRYENEPSIVGEVTTV
jgi:hypothetical protein